MKKILKGLWDLKSLKKFYMWDCEVLEEVASGMCTFVALEE
jgi:hypothetical protein